MSDSDANSDANSDAGSNDSSIYFVERILRQKYKKGKRYFLIRWIGYDESEDTWEPEENVNPIMVAYYDNNKEDGNGSDTQYTPKSKKRKVTRKNRGKKKKKNAKKVKAAPKQSEKQHPVVENNQDQEIERNEDPGAEPINDPTNAPKEEPIKEYVDPVDAYKDDQIDKYIEVTTNSSPLEHVSFGDSESSSSEDYQEASLSQAVTEKVQEVSSPHLQIQSTPKRRIELIKGYASIQFEDKKLRMLVKYEGENKFQFVLHEELRRDYPQELIDYYERSTDWSGIGLDSSITPLKNNNLYLVQSVDFFYPLLDDAFLMGKIAFANVVSDIYSCGVEEIDELKIILSIPEELNDDERQQVADDIVSGFRDSAKLIKCRLTIERININPWCMIGGIASSICTKDEIVFPTKATAGDALILTKPLGVQLATNAPIWMAEDNENWKKLSQHLSPDDINEAYQKAVKSMQTLNHIGAKLMQKYKAHCCTDVTGFGIVGHCENLLLFQENDVDFVLTHLPIIKHVKKMSEILNRQQKMLNGRMVETSGGLLIALPSENAENYCKDFLKMSGDECWIVGRVVSGSKKTILENIEIVEV